MWATAPSQREVSAHQHRYPDYFAEHLIVEYTNVEENETHYVEFKRPWEYSLCNIYKLLLQRNFQLTL